MTPQEIEELAREAGFQCLDLKLGADYEPIKLIQPVSSTTIAVELQRFAALVLERAADSCDKEWMLLEETKEAHYSLTNEPFIASRFVDIRTVEAKHRCAQELRNMAKGLG